MSDWNGERARAPVARRLDVNVVVLRRFDEEHTRYIYTAVEPSVRGEHSVIVDYTRGEMRWGCIGTRAGTSVDEERTRAHACIRQAFPGANAQCMENPQDVRLWGALSLADQHRIALARDKVREADIQLAELLKAIGDAP